MEGFKRISSEQKWLEVHGQKKWAYYYRPESKAPQLVFFDRFLKGKPSEIDTWPIVRAFVRQEGRQGEWRQFSAWPVPEVRPHRLHLDVVHGCLREIPPSEVGVRWYLATSGGVDRQGQFLGRIVCDYQFTQEVDLIGPMRLHLWVTALDTDDADPFIGIHKLGRDGQLVVFPHYAQYDDGPVALGWLRASHRELDVYRSTALQPIHRHERAMKLRLGEPVALDIEIWASGTRFMAGERLRLIIQGRDIQEYPPGKIYARHEATVNRGRHMVLSGGQYASYLTIPLIGL